MCMCVYMHVCISVCVCVCIKFHLTLPLSHELIIMVSILQIVKRARRDQAIILIAAISY